MVPSLVTGQVALFHHILHHGVVPAHLPDALTGDVVGPAVAHVAHQRQIVPDHGGDQSRPHTLKARMGQPVLPDGIVGESHGVARRLLQLSGAHAGAQAPAQLTGEGLHRYGAGHPSPLRAAHAVADHRHGVAVRRQHGAGILILAAYQTTVRYAPCSHCRSLPSSMALRRSWPQEASISPPRLRRTVAVTPWDCNLF